MTNAPAQPHRLLLMAACASMASCHTPEAPTTVDTPPASATNKVDVPPISVAIKGTLWPGGSRTKDVIAVTSSAATELCRHIPGTIHIERIELWPRPKNPRVLFERLSDGGYQVGLSFGGRLWAKCAYQFSHELCHILARYQQRDKRDWFEELICEVASLYTLRRMSESWVENAPYESWRDYAPALADYANDIIKNGALPDGTSPADYLAAHLSELEAAPRLRDIQTALAIELLPLFEAQPQGWAAIPYLNSRKDEGAAEFGTFLRRWQQRVPQHLRGFVAQIAAVLGYPLP